MESDKTVLEIRNLSVDFINRNSSVRVVDNVSFEIKQGQTLAIVGESGSGKSVTSLAIMRLLREPPASINGSVCLKTKYGDTIDLLLLKNKEMCDIRGADIAMIFQEPMTSLNPIRTIGDQVAEAAQLHISPKWHSALQIAEDMLKKIGIPEPEKRMRNYPHELSGGMRQRIMIAMALCCNPSLLIADEPSTALDVTIQAQILKLMKELQNSLKMAMLFITHDINVVARVADRVMVMYAGQVIEMGDVVTVLKRAKHPYTKGLLQSNIVSHGNRISQKALETIPGSVPDPKNFPAGCRFHPRCSYFRGGLCNTKEPELKKLDGNHLARCLLLEDSR